MRRPATGVVKLAALAIVAVAFAVGACSTTSGTSTSGDAGAGTMPDAQGSGSGSSSGSTTDAGDCGTFGAACCSGGTCSSTNLTCIDGTCGQQASDGVGKPCMKNGDCPSGICLPVGNGHDVCSATCSSATDCVNGWTCAPIAGQSSDVCQCKYAAEVCDGKDNDCDGIVDDEPLVDQECAKALGSGAVCQNGSCACGGNTTTCNGRCADTQTDDANCGTCGHACPGAQSCVGGTCSCPNSAPTFCAKTQTCVDTQNDPANCNGCGNTCLTGGVCSGGACGCPNGEQACGNACVDTQSDVSNCGGCSEYCFLLGATGNMCSNGQCSTAQQQYQACNGPGHPCGSNADCCGNECVGQGCPQTCQNGTCVCLPSGSECTSYSICCGGTACPIFGQQVCP